jgi:GNAT superfamily N-acetyltransferase
MLSLDDKEGMKYQKQRHRDSLSPRKENEGMRYMKKEKIEMSQIDREKAVKYLEKNKLLYVMMMHAIQRETANILYAESDGVLIKEIKSAAYMLAVDGFETGKSLVEGISDCAIFVAHEDFMVEYVMDKFKLKEKMECLQGVYLKKDKLPVSEDIVIKEIQESQIEQILKYYNKVSKEELRQIIKQGNLFGGYKEGKMVGFIGLHLEGSLGLLEVFPEYRRRGYGTILESFLINRQLDKGLLPFGQVVIGNEKSFALQRKLGFELSKDKLYWIF